MSFFKQLESALESLDQSAANAFKSNGKSSVEDKETPLKTIEPTVRELPDIAEKANENDEVEVVLESPQIDDATHVDEQEVDSINVDQVREQLTNQIKRILQEKENTDTSYQIAMEKKDSHMASLQRRVDELLHQVKQKTSLISDIQKEKNDLLTKQMNSSKVTSSTIAQLEDEATALNNTIEFYKTNLETEKSTSKREIESLQVQLSDAKDSLQFMTEERDTLEYEQNKTMQLCQEYESNFLKLEKEFHHHKQRANAMLKKKEELVKQLKASTTQQVPSSSSEPPSSTILQHEYDTLAAEFKELSTKCVAANEQIERLEVDHRQALIALKHELKQERDAARALSLANRKLTLANDQLSSDMLESSSTHQRQMKALKKENASLSLKINDTTKPTESLKQKLTILSNRLIEKNSQNEMLRSEKATLKLKLKRAEQSISDMQLTHRVGVKHTDHYQARHHQQEAQFVNIHSAIPVRTSKYFHAMNQSNVFIRHLARVLHELDRLSLSIGHYLRKLPLFRVLILLYILLMHVWLFYLMWQQQHVFDPHAETTPPSTIQASSTIKP
mmetsp:Transcript_8586/g.12658  ORF Transcript_8586/g.12658 Transcript_8586/m.12658 type:complete len:562 (+) Transcript_8586:71-1756(+)